MSLTVTVDDALAYFTANSPVCLDRGPGGGWKKLDHDVQAALITQARNELELTEGREFADPAYDTTDRGLVVKYGRDDYAVYEQAYHIACRDLWPPTEALTLAVPRGKKTAAKLRERAMPQISPRARLWLRVPTIKIFRG